MSYKEYLKQTGRSDDRHMWILWKIEICGMTFSEARKAADDPDWGYEPLNGEQ